MASAADIGPRRISRLLEDVRHLYGQYLMFFLPVSAPCVKLGNTLSSLNKAVSLFERNYNTGKEPRTVFCQLTLGLPNTLNALKCALISCSPENGSDLLGASDWSLALDTSSVEKFQACIKPISVAVEIINEAMEAAQNESFEMRSSETVQEMHKRIDEAKDSSARLQTLVNTFLHGITISTRLESTDGRELHTFTSANITHREVGQNIAERLKRKTQEAIKTKSTNEELLPWKIRHSIYWLSKSSDDLQEWRSENGIALSYHSIPASDKAWNVIAEIFVDALKAAWLLLDLGDLRGYEQPSFEIKKVATCAKKKTLGLLNSFFKDIFTVPNYHLINERGDFGMCMGNQQEQGQKCPQRYSSITFSPLSDPNFLRRDSGNLISHIELEAKSPTSITNMKSCLSPTELAAAPLKPSGGNGVRTIPFPADAITESTSLDGLHITHIERPSENASIDDVSARLHETELYNAETQAPSTAWTGFNHNLLSIDHNPPHNTTYTAARVRIFKLESQVSSYLRLITYREVHPVDRRTIQPSTAQLVPLYAFTDDRSDNSELYITDSGMRSSLQYRFICKDSEGGYHPWELYGFQGALMGSYFEGDYRAASVLLHRCGSLRTESERFPRIQMWTDFPFNDPAISEVSSSPSNPSKRSSSRLSSILSKDFFALTSCHTNNVNDSKIYIFSCNYIYVLFISDRVTLTLPKQRRRLYSSRHQKKTRICFVPNKNAGASAIRVRTLKGTRSTPAGIPLDPREICYGDQERAGGGFENFQSIELEFECEDDAAKFKTHFKECVAGWRQRCASAQEFRELQRSRRVTVSSTTTYEGGKRQRTIL